MGASGHWAPQLPINGGTGPTTEVRGGLKEKVAKKRTSVLEFWQARQPNRICPGKRVEATGLQDSRKEVIKKAHNTGYLLLHPGK